MRLSQERADSRKAARLLAIIGAGILAGCRPQPSATVPSPSGLVPGTYAIQLCQGSCDASENVVAEGHLVVEPIRYSVDELPPAVSEYFRKFTALMLLGTAGGSPNACFAIERRQRHPRTLAGIRATGLTLVEPDDGDSVAIVLYRSPDASHYIIVKPAGRELRGRGTSSGVADAADDYADDTVLARRIGPPDRGRCIRAAEKEAAELDALRRSPPP